MKGPAFKSRTVPSEKRAQNGQFGMVLVFLWFWMWCSKIDFEYLNTRTSCRVPPTPPQQPPLHAHSWRKIVWDTHENAGDDARWDVIAGSCTLRSPDSGVKFPLLVPLFPMETTPSAPCTCCPRVKLHRDRCRSSFGSFYYVAAAMSIDSTCQ